MTNAWLDYVAKYRKEHPDLSYKQALQAAVEPFRAHKRTVAAMRGGLERIPVGWAIWYSMLHLLYCYYCALAAGGRFIGHRVVDTTRRMLGQPTTDRRGTVYLTDEAWAGIWNMFETVFVAMCCDELYALYKQQGGDRQNGGDSLPSSPRRQSSKGHLATSQASAPRPRRTRYSVANATQTVISLIGQYRTVHDDQRRQGTWKNDPDGLRLETSIIEVQTTLSTNLQRALATAGDAMTIEHVIAAFEDSVKPHVGADDFYALNRHAYYGEFSRFILYDVAEPLEKLANSNGLASGMDFRVRLQKTLF